MKRQRSLLGSVARTAGRTAIIAGTATAVSGKVARSQAAKAGAAAAPEAAPPAAAPAGASLDEKMARLKKLEELKSSGVLSEAEFDKLKAEIMG